MKHLLSSVYNRIRASYFYPEMKQLFRLAMAVAFLFCIYNYGKILFTEQGSVWSAVFMLAVVLALVIRIYFRIMIIKYHEKDIHIRLFENIQDRV
ncbi:MULTISPECIES: hypothetical protein [unclassified Chitinophaga]|uniref:hypothetical protein n=1 Tax=unclassified Chitinophaga TaxID=2619133 RepID=UPI00117C0B55|nr:MULTISPECIES: hypothetical protein [unclassified Chitinophaga]WPV66154.1 hypothetical protein QQL36_30605 [Chitinophaga sp. LS1]